MSTSMETGFRWPMQDYRANRKYGLTVGATATLMSFLNTPASMSSLIMSATHLFNNPTDYLVSLRTYPFSVVDLASSSADVTDIKLGPAVSTNVGGKSLSLLSNSKLLGTYTISRSFNNFMDFAPYTKISCWLPYCGFIELPTNEVMGKQLKFYYSIDLDTGKCIAYIEAGGTVISSKNGTVGIDIPIGSTNAREVGRDIILSAFNDQVKTLSSALTGDVTKVVSGLGSTMINSISKNQLSARTESGGGGAKNFLATPQSIYLIIQRPKPVSITGYNALFGRPCGQSYLLSALSGYTKVDSIHLTGFSTATDQEVAEIERLLKAGVHL